MPLVALEEHFPQEVIHGNVMFYHCSRGQCRRNYMTRLALMQHVNLQHGGMNCPFLDCNLHFITWPDYRAHILNGHLGEFPHPRPWRCPCANPHEEFATYAQYDSHCIEHHTNVTFVCSSGHVHPNILFTAAIQLACNVPRLIVPARLREVRFGLGIADVHLLEATGWYYLPAGLFILNAPVLREQLEMPEPEQEQNHNQDAPNDQ